MMYEGMKSKTKLQIVQVIAPPTASACWGVSLLIHLVALLLCTFSIATASWLHGTAYGNHLKLGLWEGCLGDVCMSYSDDGGKLHRVLGDWLTVSQICACAGLVVGVAGLVTAGGVYVTGHVTSNARILLPSSILVLLSGTLYSCGVFVFMFNTYRKLDFHEDGVALSFGYSGFLGLFASISELCCAIIYALEYRKQLSRRAGYVQLK